MKKNRKPLYITLFCIDVVITVFLLVISIILLIRISTMNAASLESLEVTDLITFFMKNPTVYLFSCVVPLFLLLATNIIVLVLFVKKSTKAEVVKVNDLSEAQKEALKAELLKELQGGNDK